MTNTKETAAHKHSTLKEIVDVVTLFSFIMTLAFFIFSQYFNTFQKFVVHVCILLILVFATVIAIIHAASYSDTFAKSSQIKKAKETAAICLITNNLLLLVHIIAILLEY